MKKLLVICAATLCIKAGYSQTSDKLKSIDLFVDSVKAISLKQHTDSATVEYPAGTPFKKDVVILFYADSTSLYKSITQIYLFPNKQLGSKDTSVATSVIYYKSNQMVKAEVSLKEGGKQSLSQTSYFDGALIHTEIPANGKTLDNSAALQFLSKGYYNQFLKLKFN